MFQSLPEKHILIFRSPRGEPTGGLGTAVEGQGLGCGARGCTSIAAEAPDHKKKHCEGPTKGDAQGRHEWGMARLLSGGRWPLRVNMAPKSKDFGLLWH